MLCFLMYYLSGFIFARVYSVRLDEPHLGLDMMSEFDSEMFKVYYESFGEYKITDLGGPIFHSGKKDIIIDLRQLRYVYSVTVDCDERDVGHANVEVEGLIGIHHVVQCTPSIRESVCWSLGRKILIKNMPQGCSVRVLGYTSHLNKYIGCIKAEHDEVQMFGFSHHISSYEKCSSFCDKHDFIGLYVVGRLAGCRCFSKLKGIISVKPELCTVFCASSYDLCGGEHSYISLYYSTRVNEYPVLHPGCIVNSSGCQRCDYGWKGYTCELSDCKLNNGNCGSMECHDLYVALDLFKACSCEDGFALSDKWGECSDVDECNTVSETLCDVVSTICFNSDGSYSCKCRDGFRSDDMKISVCQDLDECMANPCDRTSTNCINIPGSFECSCFRGYHKIGPVRCEDDDECGSLFRKCPIGVPCVNLPGGYECYCPNGTKEMVYFHGTVCEDIDECLDYYICDRKSSFCVNAIMSYACICRLGFVKVDNFTCIAQDGRFTEESTGTVSSEISTNEPAEESRTTSNAFYFGLGFLIILCMFSCLACLCIVAKKAKSLVSNQSSGSSVEMEVHEEEILE